MISMVHLFDILRRLGGVERGDNLPRVLPEHRGLTIAGSRRRPDQTHLRARSSIEERPSAKTTDLRNYTRHNFHHCGCREAACGTHLALAASGRGEQRARAGLHPPPATHDPMTRYDLPRKLFGGADFGA